MMNSAFKTPLLFLQLMYLMFVTTSAKSSRHLQEEPSSCTSCIDRGQKVVHAFYHGNEDDPVLTSSLSAATVAGIRHGVTFQTRVYPSFDSTSMARDIRRVVYDGDADAIIASTQSWEARVALKEAAAAGIAVFGVGSLYYDDNQQYYNFSELGWAANIGQDEYHAGQVAANRFFETTQGVNKVIYVDGTSDETLTMEQRYAGFRDAILSNRPNATVEHVQLDMWTPFSSYNVETRLEPLLETCDIDVIMSGGPSLALSAAVQRRNKKCTNRTALYGTFDATSDVVSGIAAGEVLFAVSPRKYLRATVPVLLASLYVTTGKLLADASSPFVTGPVVVDSSTLRSGSFQSCSDDGLGCNNGESIRIGTVFDVDTAMSAGGRVLTAASEQVARDLGLSLDVHVVPEEEMVEKVNSLCQNDVLDGLFVSLPSATVAQAVQFCESVGVTVIVVEKEARYAPDSSKSVGVFQTEGADMSATYFQGYLSVALLSYLRQSGTEYNYTFHMAPGHTTSPFSAFQQTCSLDSFRMCENVADETGSSNDLDQQPTDSSIVATKDHGWSTVNLIVKIFCVFFGLLGVTVACYFVTLGTIHVLNARRASAQINNDDATVSIEEDEQEAGEDDLEMDKDSQTAVTSHSSL